MAAASSTPMGILASRAAEPVGWCACGPRSRYVAATSSRSKITRNRARDEDEIVWLSYPASSSGPGAAAKG